MRVLHIDSSARAGGSNSRNLSAHFVSELSIASSDITVDRLDLAVSPPRHVSELQTAAMYVPSEERSADMVNALWESEALCDRIIDADAIVCGIPMYNFGVPSVFKAFIDNIVRVGRTFDYGNEGPNGRLGDKRVLCVTTRGADYGHGGMMAGQDCLTPHLKTVFAFMGVSDLQFVDAQPLQFSGQEAKDSALADAKDKLSKIAQNWART